MNLEENQNLNTKIAMCIIMGKADKIETSGNEINVIYKINKIFDLSLYSFNAKTDEKFNLVKEVLKQCLEQPDEVVFNKVYVSESKFIDTDSKRFPALFHATSTFFLDSIREHGLGAVSIQKKYALQEMLDELYNAFVEKELFPPMTDEDKKDKCFWSDGTAWIANKYGHDNILHKAFNAINLCNRTYCTEETSYAYGELYFTTDINRAKNYSENTVGECLMSLVTAFKVYYKKAGDFIRFNNPVHQELIDSIFDYNTCEIKSSIKPVILIAENVALSDVLSEGSRNKVESLPKIINAESYCYCMQNSYIYVGNPIKMDDVTVVEDLSVFSDTAMNILDKYTTGNRVKV